MDACEGPDHGPQDPICGALILWTSETRSLKCHYPLEILGLFLSKSDCFEIVCSFNFTSGNFFFDMKCFEFHVV